MSFLRRSTSLFRVFACLLLVVLSVSCELDDFLGSSGSSDRSISRERIADGLREALSVGIDSASAELGRAGGYLANEIIRVTLPEDVSTALSFVDSLETGIQLISLAGPLFGYDFSVFNGMRDSMIISMNRAAEKAAPLSVGIFKDAIHGMTINDATGILYGDSAAATSFLKTKTFSPLTDLYSPFVDSTLSETGAHHAWDGISGNYNAVADMYNALPFFVQNQLPELPYDSLTTDLAQYTTEEALSGLFWAVGQEEARIRSNPAERVSELLQDVFSLQD